MSRPRFVAPFSSAAVLGDLRAVPALARPRFVAPFSSAACIAAVALALFSNPVLSQSDDDFVPVTDAMLQDPDPPDWPMWRRTLDGWGFRCR